MTKWIRSHLFEVVFTIYVLLVFATSAPILVQSASWVIGTLPAANVNGQIAVTAPPYSASGSANTYTASTCTAISAGSCTSGAGNLLLAQTATDFVTGNYVAIPIAGQASPLVTGPFAIGAATGLGLTTGTDTVCYKVATGDPVEGIHDVSASTKYATAPLPMAPDWLSNTAYTTNVSYVFPLLGNSGHYVFLATTGGTSNSTSVVPTALSEIGNIVTVTVANTFVAGQQVVMAGNTPAGYNGTYQILSAAAGNFTYYNNTTLLGAGSVFGTAINGPTWPQTVGNTVADGTVTWTNKGPVFSTNAGVSLAFTGNSNANTVYGVYRDGPEATDCNLDANSAYKFIGTTNSSTYTDYAGDSPKTWDWPATTPVTRNETAYCKVTSVSTTTNANDTLAVDCTKGQNQVNVVNTATSVTIRHDDTIASQTAYDAATPGKQVYWPAGTYHLDMVMIKNPSTGAREGYFFQASNLGDDASGIIQIEGNKVRTTGAGQDKTFLINDWAWVANVRDVMFNIATIATIAGYNGPETAAGAPRWAFDTIDNVTRGSLCFNRRTTSLTLAIGDYVYFSGGAAINGNYHIANISPITSIGAAGDPNLVCVRDAATSDVPFGTVGQAAYIEDLTANNVMQNDMTFEDMTIQTGSSGFSFVDNYQLTWQNLNYPEVPASAASGEFNYGQWGSKVRLLNSNIVANFQEFPVDSYLVLDKDQIRIMQPLSKLSFDGASSTLDVTNNLIELACGGQFVDEMTEPEVHIVNNKIISVCPTGPSAQEAGLFLVGNSPTLPVGYDHMIANNILMTNQKAIMVLGVASAPLVPNFSFINNTITWIHGVFSASAITFGSSAKVLGNKVTNIQTNAAQGVSIFAYNVPTGGPGATIQNNQVVDAGQADATGVIITDPGVVYSNPILVSNNSCDGCFRGITVSSTTDTPKVMLSGNRYKGPGLPLNPATLAYGVDCGHGLSLPGLSANSGALTAGSTDCGGEVAGAGGIATSVVVTFSSSYNQKPFCWVMPETHADVCTVSASAITCTVTAADSFEYGCPQSEGRTN